MIQCKPLPSQKVLQHHFDYAQATGVLKCKYLKESIQGGPANINHWNGRRAGKSCFMLSPCKKYYTLKWKRKVLKVHRVIWKLVYGTDPELLDHKDGDSFNNRINNLREATVAENSKNIFLPKRNSSGVTGVSAFTRYNAQYWQAAIRHKGVKKHLYQGKDFFEAVCRRKAAELELGVINYNHNHVKNKLES